MMNLSKLTSNNGAMRCHRASLTGPLILRPILLRIEDKQLAGLRRSFHPKRRNDNDFERRRVDEYKRYCQSKLRRKTGHQHPRTQVVYDNQHPWQTWEWGWGRYKPNYSNSQNQKNMEKDFWESEQSRMQKRIEQVKKQIEADPYAALFGRRLEPFSLWDKNDHTWSDFWRSFIGLDKDTKAKPKDINVHSSSVTHSPSTPEKAEPPKQADETPPQLDLEFDPISGRMAPKKDNSLDVMSGNTQCESEGPGDIPVKRSEMEELENSKDDSDSLKKVSDDLFVESKKIKDEQFVSEELNEPGISQMDEGSARILNHDKKDGSASNATTAEPAKGSTLNSVESISHVTEQEKNEDLDLLRASDIRASYESKKLSPDSNVRRQKQEKHNDLEEIYNSADPAGDIDAQTIREGFQHHEFESKDEKATSSLDTSGTSQSQSQSQRPTELVDVSDEDIPPKSPHQNTDTVHSSRLAFYRVLAYDPSTLQVTKAETRSTLDTTTETFHPAEVLPRLSNPAKFLPYFTEMQNDGYEIVAGGGDILVFKKSKTNDENINGQTDTKAGSESSPSTTPDNSRATNSHMKRESRFHKTIRRILFTGVATAATCYALGVVVEYFRTGGEYGLGIDGFTEFESERRHRDKA